MIEDAGEHAEEAQAPDPYFSSFGYLGRVQLVLLMEALPAATLPLWWGALQDQRGYSLVDYGVVQTAGAVGMLTVGLILAPLIARIDRRLAIMTLAALFAGSLLGIIYLPAVAAIVLLWGLASFSTAGIENLGLAYLGYSADAQRNNGIYVTIQTLTFGAAPMAFPYVLSAVGIHGVLVGFALVVVAIMPMVWNLPARLPELNSPIVEAGPRQPRSRSFWFASAGAIFAFSLFAWYTVTLFNFSEQLGRMHKLDLSAVGTALGLAGFLGIPGSLLAAYGGKRLGTLMPVIIGGVLFAVGTILLAWPGTDFLTFAAALVLTSFCWNLMMPYLLSIFGAIDPQGRVLAASYPVRGVASILLSGATAALLTDHGASAVAWLCALCIVLSVLSYAATWFIVRRSSSFAAQ